MYLTDKLVIDLNNKDMFPDYYTYSWEKKPEKLNFSEKPYNKIISEVAANARKTLGFD